MPLGYGDVAIIKESDGIKHRSLAREVWEGWKGFGKKLGDFQARLLLTVFYFVLLSPFALALRRWADPLTIKSSAASGWRLRSDGEFSPMERATKQF